MAQFESAYEEFVKRDTAVVFISPQKINGLFRGKQHVQAQAYRFPVLFDESRQITRAYGVHHAVGIDAYNIARRAVFLIGSQGKILWIAISPRQTEAPSIDSVLRAIEASGTH